MEHKPLSGILIVNNIKSVGEILLIIRKYSQVFTANPIKILSGEVEKHASEIRGYQQKYKIQMVPALITKDGNITIGKAKICAFLPEFAHLLNRPQQPNVEATTEDNDPYQQSSDFPSDDEEDASAEKMAQKMAQYRKEMQKRNAQILHVDAAAPGVQSKQEQAPEDDDILPPKTTTMPPHAPTVASRKGEDVFLSKFDMMMEELQAQ